MTHIPIAIVGAGMTGLAAARTLPPSSYQIFEKSRGPGGRLASKRIEQQRADIGAQFFTVRDPRFQALVELAYSAGAIQSWKPRMGTFQSSMPVDSPDTQTRYVGAPYMNALGRFLSQSVRIESQTRIDTIRRDGSDFVLTTTTGATYSAEQVLVTTPVDQMADLLAQFEIAPIVKQFTMEPTWTTVVSSDQQLTTSMHEPIDACFGGDHSVFDFISVERSKPGRDSDLIVVQASPEWSKVHLEHESNWVAQTIATELTNTFGIAAEPVLSHRWRYARPTDPKMTTQKGIYQVDAGLWIAGDYLAGGRVEGAYLAGFEAAERLS